MRSAVTARSALEASDLERLETLGDAFLKFAVGLDCLVIARTWWQVSSMPVCTEAHPVLDGLQPCVCECGGLAAAAMSGLFAVLLSRKERDVPVCWVCGSSSQAPCKLPQAWPWLQVSAQLFTAHRQYHEGQLTKRKELVVANIHLAEAAVRVSCRWCAGWASPLIRACTPSLPFTS